MYRYHIIFRVMAVISLRSIVGFPEGRSVRSVISVIKLCHVSSRPPTLPCLNRTNFSISIHSHMCQLQIWREEGKK